MTGEETEAPSFTREAIEARKRARQETQAAGFGEAMAATVDPKVLQEAREGSPDARRAQATAETAERMMAQEPAGTWEALLGDVLDTLGAIEDIIRDDGPAEAPIGAPVPHPESRGSLTPEELQGIMEKVTGALDEQQARGMISPEGRLKAHGGDLGASTGDLTADTLAASEASRTGTNWLDDITAPRNRRFLTETSKVIEASEGRSAVAYDDHTGRRVVPGQSLKGDPTIGVGFNLKRPDAKALIEQVGADYEEVRLGREALDREQQDRLLGLTLQKTANWLRDHFEGVTMPNHRWQALISIAYNSRWNDRGPTLIGPKLSKAIKAGDWQAAAQEIAENSDGGVPAHLRPAIRARRRREAQLFLGSLVAAQGPTGP